jgi:hypothetical protein
MASTYTVNSGIELIANGEQSGTWGDTTNVNLQIIDRLTNGVGNITLSGTTHTLTTTDGSLSDGQYKVLVFGGSPSGTNTVTVSPNDQDKLFFVKNNSGQSVTISQGSGGNVTVKNGKSSVVYADGAGSGAAVVDLTSTFDFTTLTGLTPTVAHGIVADGTDFISTGSSTDALLMPSGTTAQRPSAANGMFRYNSDDAAFEGYADGAWGAIGGGGTEAGGAIVTNLTTASESYTFPSGTNGMSVGPITISSGVTVTVASGQRWVVL